MGTPFDFLRAEFPAVHESAIKACVAALGDARISCFYARVAVESAVTWAFEHDRTLPRPYDAGLSTLLHEPAFKALMGDQVFRKAKEVIRLGNRAAHDTSPPSNRDAVAAVSHLFEFLYWFGRTYIRGEKPPADLRFDPRTLPPPAPNPLATAAKIRELQDEVEQAELARAHAMELVADRDRLEAELARLQAEVAEAKHRAAATPDTHDYSESETREFLIDLQLGESGWPLTDARDREFEVSGMPTGPGNQSGRGFVDYVLWGDDGAPLAIVEAKKTGVSPSVGEQQAKLYADCLEAQFGRRPVIFYSNGIETWLWDDQTAPPRRVAGFRTRSELELMIQRRSTRLRLGGVSIDAEIAGRFYQERAIRRIAESFDVDGQRKALVVMATGAGKTRTVVALADVLVRANWAKRILFLADRQALVKQAVNAFKEHLPDSSPVNLLTEKDTDGRVYVSTYQTMMNLIPTKDADGVSRFGPGHFDLVVIDEAHRSVFAKYRAIFDWFDSLLVGLTATPKSEIDRNTYDLFDLETGVPTDEYGIDAAVEDGFLVPLRAVSVPLKFQREGIRYADLPPEEQAAWDELEWDDDGPPDEVGAEAVNRWLFNEDTVDKVLAYVMTNGLKVDGGDKLAKTIIFAKNQRHAEFIAQRFNANYPAYKGEFARVITNRTEYAQDLIDKFSIPASYPQIAISVDMLDTGIDVPDVANLVFFKIVRSATKFWQMVGRGTRLRPDLYGPGQDKDCFYIFDFCQNLEYFGQNPAGQDGAGGVPLSTRLFTRRVELIGTLDKLDVHAAERHDLAELLRADIESMNLDNFVVRPHRRLVERFREADAWAPNQLDDTAVGELVDTIAALPTQTEPEALESKQFDLIVLNLQLAMLRTEPTLDRLQRQVRTIAAILEDHSGVPAIAAELALIQDLQTDEWWTDATFPMVEDARRRLRPLVALISKGSRDPLYTDFTDELGEAVEVDLPRGAVDDFAQFRKKALVFMRDHEDQLAVQRLRRNQPITETDIAELERLLGEVGGTADHLERASVEAGSLGLFVRSLVGMDRSAAKDAFAAFLDDQRYNANQIEYVNMVIDHLAASGTIEARRFYESPYTDVAPEGPDGLFEPVDVDRLIAVVHDIRSRAEAG
ncbi:MAG TPA: DEAD/DEAH box helicase family protein [Microthrixaceae bacterium]|nr:DEAD/DEAH box helicase family protein [Microthrixaceae bacterium]